MVALEHRCAIIQHRNKERTVAKLTAPTDFTVDQNGIKFSVKFKLTKSVERDWAPFDLLQTMISDDANMLVALAETKTAIRAKRFIAEKIAAGLTRHECSYEILARRSQQPLF
jgi:hypothetical protein